jgi:hypothetical protein
MPRIRPLSRDTYRRLVLLNTAILLVIVGAGVIGVVLALKNHRVRALLTAVIDRELSQSDTAAAVRGDRAAAPLERWELKIKSQDMRQVEELAVTLREIGALTNANKRWFPAELTVDGERYRVKVRLRGDLDHHWRGAKKSWRLRLKSEKLFRGMRDIDLILPRDKGYEVEPVAYQAARDLDLIVPPAGFVLVALNGVDLGAYFWREIPGKEALEKLGRPEGEIFAEQNTWIQEFFTGRGIYRIPSPAISFHPANWQPKVFDDSPEVGFASARWQAFLELITTPPRRNDGSQDSDGSQGRDGDEHRADRFGREIATILDIDRYLAWNALTWLFGSTHSHWGDNLNWYYDPTTGRFQPLLYDVFRYRLENNKLGTFEGEEHDDLALRLLRDPAMRRRRNRLLWRLVNEERFDLAARAQEAFDGIAPHLVRGVDAPTRGEVADFQRQTQEILGHNRKLIRDHLAFGRLFVAPTLAVETDGGEVAIVRVDLVPDALVPVELQAVDLTLDPNLGSRVEHRLGSVRTWAADAWIEDPAGKTRPLRVTATVMGTGTTMGTTVRFSFEELLLDTPVDEHLVPQLGRYRLRIALPALDVGAWRTPGLVTVMAWQTRHDLTEAPLEESHIFQAAPAYDFSPPLPALPFEMATASPVERALALARAQGLKLTLALTVVPTLATRSETGFDGSMLVLAAGRHHLDGDLVLPPGIGLRFEPGVILAMAPGATLMIRGPLDAQGTAAQPIVVEPAVPGAAWGSLGVVAPGALSVVRHMTVRGGSEDRIAGVYLSGQLAFYDASVEITDSVIADGGADDGLNVKRGTVDIRTTTFVGNAFDAFDGDFVAGQVVDSCFLRNGGDGIDLSGATLTVERTLFAGLGDKGISVGERSTVTVTNVVVRDSLIGVAVKDLSEAEIADSVFDANATALALYRKKLIFGGGQATVTSSLFWDNQADLAVDELSRLHLRAVGLRAAPDLSSITSEDLRLAIPDDHYRRQGLAGYAFTGGASSPFVRAHPAGATGAIGLRQPVDDSRCQIFPGAG